jgi:glycerol uptake facilitator-like aquaporin
LRTLGEKYCKVKNEHLRVFLGEFLAEMIYVTIGLGSIAQFKLSIVYLPVLADPLALFWGYAVGAMFAVLICGKVSGMFI